MSLQLKYRPLASAIVLSLFAIISCQEELRQETEIPGDKITFHVENDSEPETKGGKESQDITLEVGGHKVNINFTEEMPATRGAAYDNDAHQIPSINVSAMIENGDGGRSYFKNEIVDITSGNGVSERFWPDQSLSFFAYSVSKDNVTISPSFFRENRKSMGSFAYTLPAASADNPKNDATNQPDIVFAISTDQLKTTNSGKVDLIFHHALSAISFKVGTMKPGRVEIKSIGLKGVYDSGECLMTSEAGKDIDFVWTFDGQPQNGHYTEDINMTIDKEDGDDEGKLMNEAEATFMMLPQDMSEDTKFVMTFSIEGREYILEKAFNAFLTSWEADKKYVFKIGLPDEIDVDIEDQVEGYIKKNVTIQNPGIATGYIRAAVVGYWVSNSTGRICDPWRADEGTFVYGADWNSKWKKGTDGFYYHLEPVEHNAFTYPLFTTYTINDSAKGQHADHTLEIDLAVQIIPVSEKALWPELN